MRSSNLVNQCSLYYQQLSVCVCLYVNQGGTNLSLCTQTLVYGQYHTPKNDILNQQIEPHRPRGAYYQNLQIVGLLDILTA